MSETALGILLGLSAAVAFESSYVLLAAQARRAPRLARPGASFLVRLARRPWWLAAMGLNGIAFALEVAALSRVSLVVVQPLLAVGLLGLLVASRVILRETVGLRQFAAATLIAGGAVLVVIGAPTGTTGLSAGLWTVLTVIALLAVLFAPQVGRDGAWSLVAAAAAGDTLVALSTNTVATNWKHDIAVALGAVVAVAVCGLTSVTSESAALQRLPASRVGPIVSGAQTTVPTVIAVVLGDQSWKSATGGGLPLALGVLLVATGAVLLGGRTSRTLRRHEVDERLGGR